MRLIVVNALLVPLFIAGTALAQVPMPRPVETALAGPASVQISGLGNVEAVLSVSDVDLYRTIFALQEDGRWSDVDALTRRLQDRRLMGYVLAQRYLHPTKYRSKFSELRKWMAKYADHPQARRIHALAKRRQPKGAKAVRAPIVNRLASLATEAQKASESRPGFSRANTQQGRRLQSNIRSRIGKGWPTGAIELLDQPSTRTLLTTTQIGQALRDVSRAYYRAGKDAEALATADQSIKTAPNKVPLAYWWGGLAAWRAGDVDTADRHFTALANIDDTSEWMKSAAAFWSARASLINRRPADVTPMLERGAQFPLTFYGLLSKRALGEPLQIDWRQPPLSEAAFQEIADTNYGGRAVALLQLGLARKAEFELSGLAARQRVLRPDILALASRENLPALTLKLAATTDDSTRNAALYPLPDWDLDDAFTIDRALIYAFVRQESAFNERAQSRAGARGLMQLMPRTASFVAGQRSLRGGKKDKLFNPNLNISLGQRYIGHLLSDRSIPDDLFRLTTAYNAGPGNLRNWEHKINYHDDPLLFIESLPSRETRLFIERVLTNLWLYRDRLGQPTPSLDDVVAGSWPGYRKLDGKVGRQTADEQY
ncbi:MAG: soluble lytic murein transglycosylase [Alphaproteobacteria bacterium]|jgi:soluble lytic murein transglycosylase